MKNNNDKPKEIRFVDIEINKQFYHKGDLYKKSSPTHAISKGEYYSFFSQNLVKLKS